MTDFYAVIRSAIDRIGAQDGGERERVYSHVRDITGRKLQGHRPPLSPTEIERRTRDLDEAIARIESEVAGPLEAEPPPILANEPSGRSDRWSPPYAPGPGSQIIRLDRDAAIPDSVWGSSAIDLAWDKTTEQWLDPSDLPRREPPMPASEWEKRLGVALSDERGYSNGARSLGRNDSGPDPTVAKAERSRKPNGAAVAAGESSRLGQPAAPWPNAAEPGAPAQPVTDDHVPKAEPRPSRRGFGRRTSGAANNPAPADLGFARSKRERTEPFFAEPRSAAGAADGTVLYLEHARAPRVERPAPGLVAPPPPPDEEAPGALTDDEDFEAETAPVKVRRSAGRRFTMVIGALAVLVLAWCAYVFLPLLFPGGSDPANEPAVEETLAAPARGQPISLFTGDNPTVFDAAPDNPVRYQLDAVGGFVRIISSASGGARAVIGPGVAELLGGRQIRIALNARGSPGREAATIRIGYQRGVTMLEWRTVALTEAFALVTVEWPIPVVRGAGNDYLVIEPGIPGDGTAVDIREITVEILE